MISICCFKVKNSSLTKEFNLLLAEEGVWGMFVKGVTARMSQSCVFSCLVIFGYESIKRLSLLPEYKDHVRW